jgi:hypothetical protein
MVQVFRRKLCGKSKEREENKLMISQG